jgi:spore coat protein U-like protein
MKKISILIFFNIFISVNVNADCGYHLEAPNFSYVVSTNNPAVQSNLSLYREKSNGPCSHFFLTFSKGSAGNYIRSAKNSFNNELLYYNIYKFGNSTGVLKEVNDISSDEETIADTILKNETKTYSYYVSLAPSGATPPAAGTYLDHIQIQAYSGTFNNTKSFEDHREITLSFIVAKFTSISLVDSGGLYDPAQTSKTLDFGELTTGEELGFDIRIVSNSGYRLKISSSNNGSLKLANSLDTAGNITYQFYANGSLIGLDHSGSSPVTIASGGGVTSPQGAQVPIRVVIGNVDSTKLPGSYQDYLTLTAISTD